MQIAGTKNHGVVTSADNGDLTKTRNYKVYLEQMENNALIKYKETKHFVVPGKIGDIGCAGGSWIKEAASDKRFNSSEFYGVEITRHFFELCKKRREDGYFPTTNISFAMADASKGLVFEKASMNTIHTSSIAHEILSYGSIGTLKKFIKLRFEELAPAGVWINRDVVGPDNKNQPILMKLNKADGRNSNIFKDANEFKDNKTLFEYLSGLSTFSKFLRFCSDFKGYDNYARGIGFEKHSGEEFISLTLRDACEFISKKDYLGNWQSEMHETFCFWELSEWKTALEDTGFVVDERSHSYANNWILKNRVNGRVELFKLNEDNELKELQFPVTNMIIVGIKPR